MIDVPAAAADSLLQERRSIRMFRDEPVSRDVLDQILRVALWAPSPHHSQPWRLTVLWSESSRRDLALAMGERLTSDLRSQDVPPTVVERQVARSRDRIEGAPVAVLCSTVDSGLRLSGDSRLDRLERQMAVQSVGALLQSLFLAAHARGIGSCWMAAPMYCPDAVRSALQLPPSFSPQALVLLGYAADGGRLRSRHDPAALVEYR